MRQAARFLSTRGLASNSLLILSDGGPFIGRLLVDRTQRVASVSCAPGTRSFPTLSKFPDVIEVDGKIGACGEAGPGQRQYRPTMIQKLRPKQGVTGPGPRHS